MLKIGIECESIEDRETWGVGRIVKKLLEEISKRPELQKEFKFFLYFKSKIPDLSYLDNPIFIKKIIGIPSFSLYYYLFLPIKLWSEGLDMVFFPNYMLSPFFRGKSLVMLTEDIYYEINSGTLPFRYKLAYKVFAGWWAARHATKIMAISETSKREISNLFRIAPERIVVNHLGVDQPMPLTTNYSLPTTNYILYIGQAFPRRHLRETMLAFEIIADSAKPARMTLALQGSSLQLLRLIAIGKDKYNPPIIEKLVKKIKGRLGYDGIIYKEYVSEEELEKLYAGAKALIYISSKEAFGLPPLEALARGTIPIVTDSAITREIFGDNAFFVNNQDNPEAIAETIKIALTDEQKRREIIRSAPEILARYTWQKHTDKFLNIVRGFK